MQTAETAPTAETGRTTCRCRVQQVVPVPDLVVTFGQSKEYFYEGLREGRFPGVKFGRSWAFPRDFVDGFIADVVELGLPISFEDYAAHWMAKAIRRAA